METVLKYINQKLSEMNITYEYYEWTGEDVYPYFVGSYDHDNKRYEDGYTSGRFTINGWTRGNMLELVNIGDEIVNTFTDHQVIIDDHFLYINVEINQTLPTGEEELKRLMIVLSVEEWEGNTWD